MRKNCSKDVSRERRIEILFVFGVFLFYFLWSCTQRYNFSSDESMRYQIPQFIYEYGKLPRGDEPLIRNEDWGISYAFNPILSYMASAVLMKGMSLFSTDEWMLLISARFVNVLLGALTAWVVLKTAKLLFPRRYAWMFTTLVVFLPGNVILYSYVNCDVFDGHYLLFLGKGVQRGMELDHVCGIGRWNGNLFLVVLQCVWIYSDDVFLLCGNDADGPVETGQRTMERNDPKRSFYFGDRLCHCSVVVYSKCYSLWRRFSGTPGIERKRGTVCKIPVQAVAQQDLPEKRRLHVAYDLL
jgi:hypothetical protein